MRPTSLALLALLCAGLLGIQGGRSTRGEAPPQPGGPCNVADDFEQDTIGTDWIEAGPNAPNAFEISGGTLNSTVPVASREWMLYQSTVASSNQWCVFDWVATVDNNDELGCVFRAPSATWQAGDALYFVAVNRYGSTKWDKFEHPAVRVGLTSSDLGVFPVAGWSFAIILDDDGGAGDRIRVWHSTSPGAFSTCDNLDPNCGWGPPNATEPDWGWAGKVTTGDYVGIAMRDTVALGQPTWDNWEAGPLAGEECP